MPRPTDDGVVTGWVGVWGGLMKIFSVECPSHTLLGKRRAWTSRDVVGSKINELFVNKSPRPLRKSLLFPGLRLARLKLAALTRG